MMLSQFLPWFLGRYLVRPASEFPKKSGAERKREKQEQKAVKRQAIFGKKYPKTSKDSDMVDRQRENEDRKLHDCTRRDSSE